MTGSMTFWSVGMTFCAKGHPQKTPPYQPKITFMTFYDLLDYPDQMRTCKARARVYAHTHVLVLGSLKGQKVIHTIHSWLSDRTNRLYYLLRKRSASEGTTMNHPLTDVAMEPNRRGEYLRVGDLVTFFRGSHHVRGRITDVHLPFGDIVTVTWDKNTAGYPKVYAVTKFVRVTP